MSSQPRKMRILALHGYTSNAFILQRRLGAIRKSCRDVAEFTFVNGPIRVEPITAPAQSLDAPERQSSVDDDSVPLEEQPRAWWRADDEGRYVQFDDSIQYLNAELQREVESNGPFDGVFGFSQGAGFAGMLASAFEDPSRYPKLKLPNGQGPLRFCIAVSGFRARDPSLDTLFPSSGIQTPFLHVLGRADQIVDEDRAQTLVQAAANSRVEYHESGHVIPSQAAWRNFFRDFIATFQRDDDAEQDWRTVVGPSDRPKGDQSEPPSGTATPTGKGDNKSSL